jgi:hypothetical protein
MRVLLVGFLLSLCITIIPGQLFADDFRDGVRAYNQKHFSRALTLWLPLAEQDNELVQTLVGTMYAYGEGTEQNDKEAVKWFTRAAIHGSAQAQYNLGIMYEQGFGVEKDLNAARRWLLAAAAQGREEARQRLETLPTTPVARAATSPVVPPAPMPDTAPKKERLGPPDVDSSPDTSAGQTWLQQQPAANYTIQLAASVDEKLIDAYLKDIHLDDALVQIKSKRNGKTWHAIIYGTYASFGEALQALSKLPKDLRAWQPWIRPIAEIQAFRNNK